MSVLLRDPIQFPSSVFHPRKIAVKFDQRPTPNPEDVIVGAAGNILLFARNGEIAELIKISRAFF